MVGDVLASTILCEHVKIHFPSSQVHYLINENTKAVVEGNPYIDQTIIFLNTYKKNKLAFLGFLKTISTNHYDVVIDVYCKLESNLISLFSGSSLKVSYRKWYSSFIYNHLLERSTNNNTALGWAMENRLLLLSPIISKLQIPNLSPKIHLCQEETAKAKETLVKNEICSKKSIIMIGIQGSCPSKSYPLDYLAQVIDSINENFEVTLLVNYIPTQKDKLQDLLSLCSEKSRVAIREEVFGVDLRSFIGLLSQCDGYIGNEGGASNISKALGIPNFSIFSPWISKKAWLTFNINSANRGVHLADYEPNIGKIPRKSLKKNAQDLYRRFQPELFKKDLLKFIEQEIFPHK